MTPAGGEFATARKGITPDGLRFAYKMLQRGMSYQGAAKASGIAETDLRHMLIAPDPRPSFSPPRSITKPRTRKRKVVTCPLGDCAPATKAVVAAVAREYGVTIADLVGQERKRPVSVARAAAYTAVRRERPGLSLPEIGRIFGGRDHTTIMHGLAKHEAREAWAAVMFAFADFAPAEWKVAA